MATAGWLGAIGSGIWFVAAFGAAVGALRSPVATAATGLGWSFVAVLALAGAALASVMVRSPALVPTWRSALCFGPLAAASAWATWRLWANHQHPAWIAASGAATLLLLAAGFGEDRAELDDVLRGHRIGWVLGGVLGAAVGACLAWRWAPSLGPITAALGPLSVWMVIPAGWLAAIAAVSGRRMLAIVATIAALAVSLPSEPWAGFAPGSCATSDRTDGVRVLATNVFIGTKRADRVVDLVAERTPDVIVISELHDDLAADLDDRLPDHPHRLVAATSNPDGIGIYSRFPLRDPIVGPMIGNDRVAATVDAPGGAIRIHGVHITTPVSQSAVEVWRADFEHLAGVVGREGGPAMVIGDLNATEHNIELRRFAEASGLRQSHTGCGWRATWPEGSSVPPLFELDHAYLDDALDLVGQADGRLVASDHRWIEVDVRVRAPGA